MSKLIKYEDKERLGDRVFYFDESEFPDKNFTLTLYNVKDTFIHWYKDIMKYPYHCTSYDMFMDAVLGFMKYLGIIIKPEYKQFLIDEYVKPDLEINNGDELKDGDFDINWVWQILGDMYGEFGLPKLKLIDEFQCYD